MPPGTFEIESVPCGTVQAGARTAGTLNFMPQAPDRRMELREKDIPNSAGAPISLAAIVMPRRIGLILLRLFPRNSGSMKSAKNLWQSLCR